MPDETQDPDAARASAKKPARKPEPEPAPAASPPEAEALNLVELEALRSRLVAKFHGRR
jgi:hypothetical protein